MMSSYPASSPWSDRFELETAIDLSGLGDRYHPESLIVITGIRIQAAEKDSSQDTLYALRTQLVQNLDPLNAAGTDLHDYILQRVSMVTNNPPIKENSVAEHNSVVTSTTVE